jgi:predicted glycoside hydrolase/deacetylase ChbG (UPF0249 family)
MRPNPLLKKLGYSNEDRLVIIHTDDIGMCHASLQAYSELVNNGLISSAATMVPCSWFPHVALFCRQNINTDMGVHLTLTSEWDNYRWSPISTSQVESGMIDNEGYFYRSAEEAQVYGNADAVQIELQTQLIRALNAGIEVTHLDTHMNTVAHPKFVNAYTQLALKYKLPFLFPRQDEAGFIKSGLDLDKPFNRLEQAKQALGELRPGITHFIIHPSLETPELKAITPDWQSRVADYQTFMDDKLRQHINDLGVHIIGYKTLKSLLAQ